MQYLLTEDEMAEINRKTRDYEKLPTLEALINICQRVACDMIDTNPGGDRTPRATPHGCIHVGDRMAPQTPRYCDFCPMRFVCPQPKNWSK